MDGETKLSLETAGAGRDISAAPAVTEETVKRGREIFERCRRGKAALDNRVIDGEEWYRMRYDEYSGTGKAEATAAFKSTSGWLFNNIVNKHADAMDNYPRPNLLPREEGDVAEAETLSSIIPALLEQLHFEKVYSDVQYDKIKTGTGVYGIFWDGTADGGMGEVSVRHIDILSVFWDAGVSDIQRSRNLFLTTEYDKRDLEERYSQLAGKLGGSYDVASQKDYQNDFDKDKERKATVYDWYYKKWQGNREVVHLCKFCGSEVLYATENVPELSESGLYDHGKFPFVMDVMFPIKNSPAGFGNVDICKNPQMYIDKLDAAILENALQGAKPRFFVPSTLNGQSEKEFLDWNNPLVKYAGSGGDGIVPITTKPLDGSTVTALQNKITELKEISGNRDATAGGTTAGVTAASAIAAMIEAGSKPSRDAARGSWRAFREVVELIVELIRQFYTTEHHFRIVGMDGMVRFAVYTNGGLLIENTDPATGETTYRKPIFDIEITAERSSPYTRMSQNELMLQLYGAGFFSPGNADASLAAIDGMAFDQKEQVRRRIEKNGTLFAINRQLMATNEVLAAQLADPAVSGAVQEQNGQSEAVMQSLEAPASGTAVGAESAEPAHMKRTKEQVANATAPV